MTDTVTVTMKNGVVDALSVPAFFDAHVHFREEEDLARYVPPTARCCAYAVAMPNTKTPITTADQVLTYRAQIERASKTGFTPLMTLYLTRELTAAQIELAKRQAGDALVGVKLYPAGATTQSQHGVPLSWLRTPDTAPRHFLDALKAIAGNDLVLMVHGEDPDAQLTEREYAFTRCGFLEAYLRDHPEARVTLEHVSTRSGVALVHKLWSCGHRNVRGTITLHHLFLTLTQAYGQVHNTCWPPPRFLGDRDVLRELATGTSDSVSSLFFLGSDSAPHPNSAKYRPHCACGCYTAPVLAEKLAELFASYGLSAAQRLTTFTSERACAFYRVPLPSRCLRLRRVSNPAHVIQEYLPNDPETRLWDAGNTLQFVLD